MVNIKKLLIAIVLGVIFTIIYLVLNSGLEVSDISLFIQPIIFAVITIISILHTNYRKFILAASLVLLSLMIVGYLFDQLNFSNWVGSLGFGILTITIASYFLELTKKGYIEKY